jgi:hypothetical protein
MLTVFSAYRDPVGDAVDCAVRGNCGGAEKANCSAHRSGMALDIVVGAAPGQPPINTRSAPCSTSARSGILRSKASRSCSC